MWNKLVTEELKGYVNVDVLKKLKPHLFHIQYKQLFHLLAQIIGLLFRYCRHVYLILIIFILTSFIENQILRYAVYKPHLLLLSLLLYIYVIVVLRTLIMFLTYQHICTKDRKVCTCT